MESQPPALPGPGHVQVRRNNRARSLTQASLKRLGRAARVYFEIARLLEPAAELPPLPAPAPPVRARRS